MAPWLQVLQVLQDRRIAGPLRVACDQGAAGKGGVAPWNGHHRLCQKCSCWRRKLPRPGDGWSRCRDPLTMPGLRAAAAAAVTLQGLSLAARLVQPPQESARHSPLSPAPPRQAPQTDGGSLQQLGNRPAPDQLASVRWRQLAAAPAGRPPSAGRPAGKCQQVLPPRHQPPLLWMSPLNFRNPSVG